MRIWLDWRFYFSEKHTCRFPTVELTTADGKKIQCHRTITEEEWKKEPWYGRLALVSLIRIVNGRRVWIYTRWGCCLFDLLWRNRKCLA